MAEETATQIQECRILRYLLDNPEIFRILGSRIDKLKFSYTPSKYIFPVIKNIWDKYEIAPTREELEEKILETCADQPAVLKSQIDSFVERIYTIDVTKITGDIIAAKLLQNGKDDFCSRISSMSMDTFLDKVTELKDELTNLQLISGVSGVERGIYPFAADVLEDPIQRIRQDYGGCPVPVGIPRLDERNAGGLRPGELALIIGATGFGKSLVMINIALNVIASGGRVMYFALDNVRAEMLERIYTTTSRVGISEDKISQEWAERIRISQGGDHNRMYLEDHPPRGITTLDLLRSVQTQKSRWRSEDIANGVDPEEAGHVDLVIVDYGDMLKCDRAYAQVRFELQQVFKELCALAQEEKTVVLTASQANRDALSQVNITLKNLSEAFSKAWPCSHVWTICQTNQERSNNRFRLAVVKARRKFSQYLLHMIIDYDVMTITEDSSKEPEPLNEKGNEPINTAANTSSGTEIFASSWQSKMKGFANRHKVPKLVLNASPSPDPDCYDEESEIPVAKAKRSDLFIANEN